MSRVTINKVVQGDVAWAADVNSTLGTWRNHDTDIDEENVREGGLDRSSVAVDQIVPLRGSDRYRHAGFALNHAALAIVNDGVSDVMIGPVSFSDADEERMIVRCSLRMAWTAALPPVDLQLGWCLGGAGPWAPLPTTRRRFSESAALILNMTKSYTVTHLFTGGLVGLDVSDLYFCLLAITGGGAGAIYDVRLSSTLVTR